MRRASVARLERPSKRWSALAISLSASCAASSRSWRGPRWRNIQRRTSGTSSRKTRSITASSRERSRSTSSSSRRRSPIESAFGERFTSEVESARVMSLEAQDGREAGHDLEDVGDGHVGDAEVQVAAEVEPDPALERNGDPGVRAAAEVHARQRREERVELKLGPEDAPRAAAHAGVERHLRPRGGAADFEAGASEELEIPEDR